MFLPDGVTAGGGRMIPVTAECLKAIKVIAPSLDASRAKEFASGGVTRMGGDTGPLKIIEDRGLRGAALRGALAPDRARGRQAGRVETPITTVPAFV